MGLMKHIITLFFAHPARADFPDDAVMRQSDIGC
jgi:hypothetical protein